MALKSDDDMVDSDELSYTKIEQETLVIDDIKYELFIGAFGGSIFRQTK
ncbi:7432_t:CDS:2 [Cetraspora pellucida]|uniref:7432_t:CDS:1 n=1 Tax=Cetraspora pellucida TaxID=1433469 RepID=A0ACA9LZ42_9GLOM|nr:7432_t:CDS:2 [Cetraspora pellucida]